jgi:hypothetical protein
VPWWPLRPEVASSLRWRGGSCGAMEATWIGLSLPRCRGDGVGVVGCPWPTSLPPVLGIDEERVCPRPSQVADPSESKFHARRSYPRLREPLCARQSPSLFFPEAKKRSKGKIFHSCHDAEPSGSSPVPASSMWWSKLTARSVRSGAKLVGHDGFLPNFSRASSVKVQSLSQNPLIYKGFDVKCNPHLVNICNF